MWGGGAGRRVRTERATSIDTIHFTNTYLAHSDSIAMQSLVDLFDMSCANSLHKPSDFLLASTCFAQTLCTIRSALRAPRGQMRNLNPFCICCASLTVVPSSVAAAWTLSPCSSNARSPSARRLLAATRMQRNQKLSWRERGGSVSTHDDRQSEHGSADAVRVEV